MEHWVITFIKHRLAMLRLPPHHTILAIMAAAVFIFLVQEIFRLELSNVFGAIPANISQPWAQLLDGRPAVATAGALSTLITANFMHAGLQHILMNMVFLWAFGSLASHLLGKWWALVIFFLTGVCGNITEVCLHPASPIPIVGASGAVAGFAGTYLGLALRWDLPWPDVWPLARPIPPMQLAAFAVIGAVIDAYSLMQQGRGVAYGAHLGGFLSGLLLASLMTWVFPSQVAFLGAGWRR